MHGKEPLEEEVTQKTAPINIFIMDPEEMIEPIEKTYAKMVPDR